MAPWPRAGRIATVARGQGGMPLALRLNDRLGPAGCTRAVPDVPGFKPWHDTAGALDAAAGGEQECRILIRGQQLRAMRLGVLDRGASFCMAGQTGRIFSSLPSAAAGCRSGRTWRELALARPAPELVFAVPSGSACLWAVWSAFRSAAMPVAVCFAQRAFVVAAAAGMTCIWRGLTLELSGRRRYGALAARCKNSHCDARPGRHAVGSPLERPVRPRWVHTGGARCAWIQTLA
jgi:hypothetical protein